MRVAHGPFIIPKELRVAGVHNRQGLRAPATLKSNKLFLLAKLVVDEHKRRLYAGV